jgi:hypothetical protein
MNVRQEEMGGSQARVDTKCPGNEKEITDKMKKEVKATKKC